MVRKLVYGTLLVSLLGLAVVQAQGSPYIRAAYWDADYSSGWAGGGETVRDALQDAGYEVLDADALKTWMDARLADGELSVVVFCKDVVPDTVAETQDENCTIRQYLNAGGKVVWYADIPFYYVGHSGSTSDNWGDNGSINVMGFNMAGGAWDSGNTVTITEAGTAWGLTTTWASNRPASPDGWDNLTLLAVDDAGNPGAWAAHYVPGDTFRGFVRISDVGGDPGSIEDLIAVAEYYEALATASSPEPGNDAIDVPREVAIGWLSGDFAATHDVYFGTAYDDVANATRTNPLGVLVSESQAGNSFDPEGVLELGQTYYWRVDEVNAAPDNTIYPGAVWSFTVEPVAYPIANISVTTNAVSDEGAEPENTINGSGLNSADEHSVDSTDMWLGEASDDEPIYVQYEFDRTYKLHQMQVWNYNVQFELILGFGVKNATVEYSTDGAEWTSLGDIELAQGTATADYAANTTVDFEDVAAKYVRLTVNSGWGVMTQFGLSELRFLYVPSFAREPQPADDAADVSVDSMLNWRAGRDAVTHDVSLGTDPNSLVLIDTVSTDSYTPDVLDLGTTYYWQINEAQETESWEGNIWSFSTQEFLVVEDFESYNDDDNRIYETWLDGWTNETGSTVGHFESPFAEQGIVRSGRQSMPLFYDNSSSATSEAEFELSQDWSASGIQGLTLYFYGDLDNAGQLYVKINNTKIAYDGSAINIRRPAWQPWSIDLSAVSGLSNVTKLTIGVEGAGATGVVYIDDIRLYPEVLDYSSPDITGAGDTVKGVPDDGDWPGAETPDMAIDDNSATKFLHFKGGSMTTGIQVAPLVGSTIVTGLTLTTANDSPARDPITFEFSGSNASIDGPYELIAVGDVADFAGEAEWPRFTQNETPIEFQNTVAYTYYQIVFPTLRSESEGLMQIAEIELIGTVTP